jgi:hypothetical protein
MRVQERVNLSLAKSSGNVNMIHEYMHNSLVKDSSQMRRIQEAVKAAGIFVVLGVSASSLFRSV